MTNRRVEVVEGVLVDQRRDALPRAVILPALLGDHHAVGLAHGVEDEVQVNRADRAQVEYLGLDAVLRQLLRRLLADMQHARERH